MTTLRTLHYVWHACVKLDWAGKDETQAQNASRLVTKLGWETDPASITMATLDQLVAELREHGFRSRPLSNGTINRYLSALKVMLRRAQRMGLIVDLPLFPERRLLREAEPRSLLIKPEWFEAMLTGMDSPCDRDLAQFLWLTGCRVSEGLAMTWDRIGDRTITIADTKGHMPRTLPITQELGDLLARMAEQQSGALTGPIWTKSYDAFRYEFLKGRNRACDFLGLSDEIRKQWTIHGLRHTRLTKLAADGMPATLLQKYAGHSSLDVTQRYIHGSGISLEAFLEPVAWQR